MAKWPLQSNALVIFDRFAMHRDITQNEEFERTFLKNALTLWKSWLLHYKSIHKMSDSLTRCWVTRLQWYYKMLIGFYIWFDNHQAMRRKSLQIRHTKHMDSQNDRGWLHSSSSSTHRICWVLWKVGVRGADAWTQQSTRLQTRRNKRAACRRNSLKGADTNSGSHKLNAKTSKYVKTRRSDAVPSLRATKRMDVQKHINTTIHLSNQCKVLKALAKSMPRQATAVFDRNKRKNE